MKLFYFILIALSIPFISCSKSNETYFESMNTYMKVIAYGKNAEKANEEAQNKIKILEQQISTTKTESEIYRINNTNEDECTFNISENLYDLINFSLGISELTDGALNPCLYPITSSWGFTKKQYKVLSGEETSNLLKLCDWKNLELDPEKHTITKRNGMMIDLGAVGKGYAGDESIKILKNNGIKSALLDLGGNIQTIGTKPDGSPWTIGIRNPLSQGITGTLKIRGKAAITSGGYERYFIADDGNKYIHIFDGRTGFPVRNEVLSTTAITEGDNGLYGDALSTALFVMGTDKSIKLWKKQKDFDFIIITVDKKILITKNIFVDFEKNEELVDFNVIRIE